MKTNLSEILSFKLISDGEVHSLKIRNEVIFYKLLLKPIVSFSFGILKDETVIHWYPKKTFSTNPEWIAYCRDICRNSLVEKEILKQREQKVRIIKKLEVVNKILNESSYVKN